MWIYNFKDIYIVNRIETLRDQAAALFIDAKTLPGWPGLIFFNSSLTTNNHMAMVFVWQQPMPITCSAPWPIRRAVPYLRS
jgi:hypothetical protein